MLAAFRLFLFQGYALYELRLKFLAQGFHVGHVLWASSYIPNLAKVKFGEAATDILPWKDSHAQQDRRGIVKRAAIPRVDLPLSVNAAP